MIRVSDHAMRSLVEIPVASGFLPGELQAPAGARGLVLFAHGSGSSRHSPRNVFVARGLREQGLGTLLFDLLTEEEDADPEARFDIELLTERLVAVTRWVAPQWRPDAAWLAYFGASTGAASALRAAAALPDAIFAVVSRGGRPDLAAPDLARVRAPTLLIVGGDDDDVLELNRQAFARLRCEKRLHIVPGATHLFEEPGALEEVTEQAGEWFTAHQP